MSTTPLTCPECGKWLRVAVQASVISKSTDQLVVEFDTQRVAHVCRKEE